MKKYIQLAVVLALVLTAVGVAASNPAWASSLLSLRSNSAQPASVVISGSGTYNIGGICSLEVAMKATGLQDKADSEVPVTESRQVPFSGEGELFFPGCHIVHMKADKVVNEADTNDGSWKVCFGTRPEANVVIYYYLDTPESGSRVWAPLPTTIENGFACAPAVYTGVYMPAGKIKPEPAVGGATTTQPPEPIGPGSIQPPAPLGRITQSGTYSFGGICTLIVEYKQPNLSDEVKVELPTSDTKQVPFPEDQGYLYLPGCHVVHYDPIHMQVTPDMGSWKICFAAYPGKEMTIFYYLDDNSTITPPWKPLQTTVENGMACAPADYTGVYAPSGK